MLRPLFIRHEKLLKRIDPAMVTFLETQGNYTRICLSDKSFYEVRISLIAALKKLPADMFIQIHPNYIVSILFIEAIARDHLAIQGEGIPIAKEFYKSFIRKLDVIG